MEYSLMKSVILEDYSSKPKVYKNKRQNENRNLYLGMHFKICITLYKKKKEHTLFRMYIKISYQRIPPVKKCFNTCSKVWSDFPTLLLTSLTF